MPLPTLTQTYELEDIARIDVIYADGLTDQVTPRHHADADDLQSRVDNLYRSEFEEGMLNTVVAYDANGDQLAVRSANEFFGEREGF